MIKTGHDEFGGFRRRNSDSAEGSKTRSKNYESGTVLTRTVSEDNNKDMLQPCGKF